MTEIGTTADGNVQLVVIVSLSLGWLFTKGALLENHMCSGATSFVFGNAVICAVLENLFFRDVHSVVTRHKHFGSYLMGMNTLCGR